MPHAMTEAFTVEETGTEAANPNPRLGTRAGKRQPEATNACACPAPQEPYVQHSGTSAKGAQQG